MKRGQPQTEAMQTRFAAYTALRDAIITHPTLLEGLLPLFSTVPPKEKARRKSAK